MKLTVMYRRNDDRHHHHQDDDNSHRHQHRRMRRINGVLLQVLMLLLLSSAAMSFQPVAAAHFTTNGVTGSSTGSSTTNKVNRKKSDITTHRTPRKQKLPFLMRPTRAAKSREVKPLHVSSSLAAPFTTSSSSVDYSMSRTSVRPSSSESSSESSIGSWIAGLANRMTPSSRRHQSKAEADKEAAEYAKRKEAWANRYTNVDSLRETFGANRNKVWGDLDAATARRLYKTLLPKALLELVKVGVQPEDLAPLAYKARVAAKLYARERCQVPARVGACLYDGFRQWKRYGKFEIKGMSYDQVWEKYQKDVLDKYCTPSSSSSDGFVDDDDDDALEHPLERRTNGGSLDYAQCYSNSDLTEEDVTAKICLKILERSCKTNERIDKWVLPPENEEQREDLARITQTLEMDVRKLLDPISSTSSNNKKNKNNRSTSGNEHRKSRRSATAGKVDNNDMLVPATVPSTSSSSIMLHPLDEEDDDDDDVDTKNKRKQISLQKYRTLRLVARARKRARKHAMMKQQQQEQDETEVVIS